METKAEDPAAASGRNRATDLAANPGRTKPARSGLRSTLVARTTWIAARRFWCLLLRWCCAGSRSLPYSPHPARKNERRRGGRSRVWEDPKLRPSRLARPGRRIPLLSADQGARRSERRATEPGRYSGNVAPRPDRPTSRSRNAPKRRAVRAEQVPPLNDPALEAYRRQNNIRLHSAPASPSNHRSLPQVLHNQ